MAKFMEEIKDILEYIDINSIAAYNNQFWLLGNDGNIQILDEYLNLDYVIDYTDFNSIRKIDHCLGDIFLTLMFTFFILANYL